MEISKEKFIRYINAIKDIYDYKDNIYELTRKYDYLDSAVDFPTLEYELCDLLDEVMSPISRDVSYFCYEIDFGREYEEGCVSDDEGNIDFSTAEKLYDYLTSYKSKKSNGLI